MKCNKAREQFDEWLDKRLTRDGVSVLDQHVNNCPECKAEWDSYLAAWQLLNRSKPIEPSANFVDQTINRIRKPQVVVLPWYQNPKIRWNMAAAAIVTIAFGSWFGFRQVTHRRSLEQSLNTNLYAIVQDSDLLEDFDVIASLDQLNLGENEL